MCGRMVNGISKREAFSLKTGRVFPSHSSPKFGDCCLKLIQLIGKECRELPNTESDQYSPSSVLSTLTAIQGFRQEFTLGHAGKACVLLLSYDLELGLLTSLPDLLQL